MHKNIFILSFFGFGILAFAIAAVSVLVGLGGEEGVFVIRFDQEGAADISGSIGVVTGIFAVILAMIMIDLAVAWKAYTREPFISYMLGAVTAIVGLVSLGIAFSVVVAN